MREITKHTNLLGHGGAVHCLAFSADGEFCATGGGDGTLRLWETQSGRELLVLREPEREKPRDRQPWVEGVEFSPDGKLIAGAFDDTVWLWRLPEGSLFGSLLLDRNTLIRKAIEDVPRSIEPRIGRWLASTWLSLYRFFPLPVPSLTHGERIRDISFAPNGASIATGGADNMAVVWDVVRKTKRFILPRIDQGVRCVTFSADGQKLAVACLFEIKLFDVSMDSCEYNSSLHGHANSVVDLAFSPDGSVLASASFDGTARIWNLNSREELCTASGPMMEFGESKAITAVAFSPDGGTLAIGSGNGVSRFYSMQEQRPYAHVRGHHRSVFDLAFSPTGRILGTAGEDGTAKLWHLSKELIRSHTSTLYDPDQPRVFISYRRQDSADVVRKLYDSLEDRFGAQNVVLDIDSIPYGVDFREHIKARIRECDVLLAIIGEQWIETLDKGYEPTGRDWVRAEIETALSLGVHVIPVLVGTALMPSERDLPHSMKGIAYRNAAELRASNFNQHARRLVNELKDIR